MCARLSILEVNEDNLDSFFHLDKENNIGMVNVHFPRSVSTQMYISTMYQLDLEQEWLIKHILF